MALILVPAALPYRSSLRVLKIGWAFAWRTLIMAELVFEISSSQGGFRLVHLPQPQRTQLGRKVFAGLITVIMIGLFVERWYSANRPSCTIRRWGMQT